jgi:ABC-type glycerol-3-phosphate transport system substrate-binding protein
MIVQGSWRGQIYGVPGCENFALLAIGFNQRLLQEAGMTGTVDDLPKTWDEALEQVKEFSKIDDAGNIDLLWFTIEETDWAEQGALIGIETYDAENERFNFDHPGWVEYFQWLADYYDFLGVDKVSSFFDSYPGWSAVPGCSMCVGRQAGGQNGYWWPGELTNTAPDESFIYTWTPMPAIRAGVKLQMIGIHHNMVTKDSPNPEPAWRLAEYLTTNEAIKTIFDGTGFLIPTTSFMQDPASVVDIDKYEGLRFYAESLSQADELVPYPACPVDAIAYDQTRKAIDAVIYKEKSVEQSLADLQSTLTEELGKALRNS